MVVIAIPEKTLDFFQVSNHVNGMVHNTFSRRSPAVHVSVLIAVHVHFTGMILSRLKIEFRSTGHLKKIASPRASCSFSEVSDWSIL